MNAQRLLEIAAAVLSSDWFTAVLVLIAANVIGGIAVALWRDTLNLAELADWLRTRAAPLILGDLSMQVLLLAQLPAELGLASVASAAVHLAVCVALGARILQNLAELGLPIPAILRDRDKPRAVPPAQPPMATT